MSDSFRLSLRELLPRSFDDPAGWFSRLPELETPRLLLRRMRMKDVRDIYEWSSDRQVARYVLWEAHQSPGETRAYVRAMRSCYRRGAPSSWAIELKAQGKVIGTIGFMWLSRENRSAEVGYSLSRSFWNQGLMTEALSRVLQASFEELKLNRVEAQYDVRNPASGHVMEKCGMRQEGVLRNRIYNKGEYVDVAVCAILAEEYKKQAQQKSVPPAFSASEKY